MPEGRKGYEYKFRPLSKLDKPCCFVDLQLNSPMRLKLFLSGVFFLTACHLLTASEMEKVQRDVSERLVPQVLNGKIDPAVLIFTQTSADSKTIFQVSSENPFSVYSGAYLLAAHVRSFQWQADSLSGITKGISQLTFFRQHRTDLKLTQTSFRQSDPLEPMLRNRSGRMNFTIMSGSLLLILFSISLAGLSGSLRYGAELVSIFSLNIREDRTDDSKFNSSSSLVRFLIITLFASVVLTIVNRHGDGSTSYYFGAWGSNLFFLFIFFCLKVLLNVFWAWIFNLRETANYQITGFFKTILFLAAGAAIILLFNFIVFSFSQPEYFILKVFSPLVLAGYCLTLFFRLLSVSAVSPLHLFSYLCISEFIPLVLLVFTI